MGGGLKSMTATPFPCSLERTVASALLLLSSSASLSHSEIHADAGGAVVEGNQSFITSLEPADSKSCSTSLISKVPSDEIRAPKLRIIAVAAHRHEFKLQLTPRVRLNKSWSINHRESNFGEAFTKSIEFESEKDVSCLSSSSSGDSSAITQKLNKGKAKQASALDKHSANKPVGSAHIRRRADAILKFLAKGSASEVKIRQVLGDSPDTSKALRILLKREEVTRSGRGGRHHPYIYTIAKGSSDPLLV
ncbi:hypothetical protein SAY87_008406 [Trapa incisa]|uniref:HTH three-helical bundle domain-containing protein n=1 Tax=Trapa incisa TaxID=236973 RepID=A0AAN7KG06_9MYRT|nr:hypothetical protein SAY87_008406 [Trapa incisa]